MTISVDIDTKDFQRQIAAAEKKLGALAAKHVPVAAARALNKTGDRIVTRVRREIAREKGLPQNIIRKQIARYIAEPKRLVMRVWVGLKRGIPIEQLPGARFMFSGRQAGSLRAGRARVSGVFPATMPSGKQGLFVRRLPSTHASAGRSATAPNLPIEKPMIRLQPEAQPILERVSTKEAREFLPREFERLVSRTLQTLRAAK